MGEGIPGLRGAARPGHSARRANVSGREGRVLFPRLQASDLRPGRRAGRADGVSHPSSPPPSPTPIPSSEHWDLHLQLQPRGMVRAVQTDGLQQGLLLKLKGKHSLTCPALCPGLGTADAAGNVRAGRTQVRALAGCMRGWPGGAPFILELSALCGAQPRLAAACLVERATLPIRGEEVNPCLCARPNSMVTPRSSCGGCQL